MPIPINIQNYIDTAKVSEFLSADDENNFVKNPGGTIAPSTSRLINFVRKGLEWKYAIAPTDTSLTDVALYLKALIGKYWNQAFSIIGSGTGVIVNPSGNSSFTWIREQVTVAASGGTLNQGDTVWVLNYSNVLYSSVEVLIGESVLPRNDNTTQSYVLTIQSNTATVTFSQQLNQGDIVTFVGVKSI